MYSRAEKGIFVNFCLGKVAVLIYLLRQPQYTSIYTHRHFFIIIIHTYIYTHTLFDKFFIYTPNKKKRA